jgi:hypothetical protein
MASKLSDLLELVACLQASARRGDWKSAGELANSLRQQTLPGSGEEIGEYLFRLKEALVTAKVSRAHSAASLARINTAAARLKAATDFNNSRADLARADFGPARQEFGKAAEF